MRAAATLVFLLSALALLAGGATGIPSDPAPGAGSPADNAPAGNTATVTNRRGGSYKIAMLKGQVVWLDEAFQRKYGTMSEARAQHTSVVLETPEGKLVPIVPDPRGMGFTLDDRLRDKDFEMLVRLYDDAPHVQVIRLFRRVPEGLLEIDYWCDICAISMFMLEECECCHGPIRLREVLFQGDPLKQGRQNN